MPSVVGATRRSVRDTDRVSGQTGPALTEAFRPLRQWVSSACEQEIDEDATATFASVDRRWVPIHRPASELRWDVVLVVDDSVSMWPWRSTASDFARMLARQGAFRDVHVRLLSADSAGRLTVRGAAPGAQRYGITEMVDPARRRIILIMTAGAGEMWRSGQLLPALMTWGTAHPTALVNVLPWHRWNSVGLEVHRLRLRAPEAGAPNTRLDWTPQSEAPGVFDDLVGAMPVCVLELGSAGLARWARMVVAESGWTDLGALLVPRGPMMVDDREPPAGTAVELVQRFRATASTTAFELATCLAAAPLDFTLVSLIQAHVVPRATAGHLSEVLGSPLVVHVAGDGEDGVELDLAPGVRAELLAHGRVASTEQVRSIVRHQLVRLLPGVKDLGSDLDVEVLAEPGMARLLKPFMVADIAALEAMSGTGLVKARRLRRLLPIRSIELRSQGRADTPGRVPIESRSYATNATPRGDARAETAFSQHDLGGTEVTATADRHTEGRGALRASPVIFGGVPPRNPNFTGRDDLLEELDERLKPGATAAVLPEAIHGLGGVGKSALAIEYAYRFQSKFDMIWWVPAERSVQIANSLVELGQRLDLRVGSETNVAVQPVLDALKGSGEHRIPPNWLLIFDNANTPEDVQPYMPTGGPGRILVTSRNSQWLSIARPLEVRVFRRSESVQLLRRRGPELTDVEADRLAEALGDLPLAIAQAAAWRAETGMPAAEYLELLTEKQMELLDVATALDYPTSVAAAWNLSLEQLRERNLSALRLLQTCAFFAPEPVPRAMFTNSRGIEVDSDLQRVLRDRLRLNEAIRDINRFALARIDHRTNSIQMHRLVQTVLVAQMTDEEQETMRHAAHEILAANDPNAPEDIDTWPKYAELNVHQVASNAIECRQSQAVRDLLFNEAKFLFYWGEHERAANLSRRLYKIWAASDQLGPDHLDTLKVGRWLGFMLWKLGRYEEAAQHNADILAAHQQTLGSEHEDTMDAIGLVAADNRAKGEFDAALVLSKQNYENCVRLFGDEDPVTMIAAHNLGVNLRLSGHFRAARELDEATWARRVQIFGKEHPLTLNTEAGIAVDARECGAYREAQVRQEDVVATLRRTHAPLNPLLLLGLRHLAVMRRKAGDHHGALDAANESLKGFVTRYGSDHVESLAAALSKSIALRHLGRIGSATDLGMDTFDRYRRSLGDDHPHTLSAAVNVAILRRLAGDARLARELDEATLIGFRRRLGDDHPSTIVTTVNLASDLYMLGKTQAAYELDEATLQRATSVLGVDHPTVIACKANLGQDMIAIGRVEEGGRIRLEAVEELKAKLGDDHPAIVLLAGDDRANCDIDPMPL